MTSRTPSPQEIEDAMTADGGWDNRKLKSWGVEWPPKKGWRKALERKWAAENPDQSPDVVRRFAPSKPACAAMNLTNDDDFEVIE